MCSIALVLVMVMMVMLACILLVLPNRLDKSAARNWVWIFVGPQSAIVPLPLKSQQLSVVILLLDWSVAFKLQQVLCAVLVYHRVNLVSFAAAASNRSLSTLKLCFCGQDLAWSYLDLMVPRRSTSTEVPSSIHDRVDLVECVGFLETFSWQRLSKSDLVLDRLACPQYLCFNRGLHHAITFNQVLSTAFETWTCDFNRVTAVVLQFRLFDKPWKFWRLDGVEWLHYHRIQLILVSVVAFLHLCTK